MEEGRGPSLVKDNHGSWFTVQGSGLLMVHGSGFRVTMVHGEGCMVTYGSRFRVHGSRLLAFAFYFFIQCFYYRGENLEDSVNVFI